VHGYGLQESLFEFASSLGTVGLSVGLTSIDAPVLVLYTQIFGMLLGRLEFFVMVISIVKIFSDLRNSLL
jgi:trk system potassium uptake protein TrkH